MNTCEGSLRLLVGKWFGSTPLMPVRVFDFGRVTPGGARYVRVGVARPNRTLAIVFFRHGDGSWNVFPPAPGEPSMQAYPMAA
nr:hypothetical protein [Paraburkholderia ultramafica]